MRGRTLLIVVAVIVAVVSAIVIWITMDEKAKDKREADARTEAVQTVSTQLNKWGFEAPTDKLPLTDPSLYTFVGERFAPIPTNVRIKLEDGSEDTLSLRRADNNWQVGCPGANNSFKPFPLLPASPPDVAAVVVTTIKVAGC